MSAMDCSSSRVANRQSVRPHKPTELTALTYFSVSQLLPSTHTPPLAVPALPPSLMPVELNQVYVQSLSRRPSSSVLTSHCRPVTSSCTQSHGLTLYAAVWLINGVPVASSFVNEKP